MVFIVKNICVSNFFKSSVDFSVIGEWQVLLGLLTNYFTIA